MYRMMIILKLKREKNNAMVQRIINMRNVQQTIFYVKMEIDTYRREYCASKRFEK